MSKAIFSILSILALLLSGINCATGKRSGEVGDASPSTPPTPATPPTLSTPSTPPTPDWAAVLETAIDVLRDTGYEIKYKHNGQEPFSRQSDQWKTQTSRWSSMRLSPCLVYWDIRNPTYNYSTVNECDDFRSELERDLRQSLK